jgi:hypothetical protein
MRTLSMLVTAHLLGAFLVLFGLWWLIGNMAGLADYKLIVALAALTALTINQFRLWHLRRKIENREILGKVGYFIVTDYLVLLLLLALVNFGS